MDRRFLIFVLLAAIGISGWLFLRVILPGGQPQPAAAQDDEKNGEDEGSEKAAEPKSVVPPADPAKKPADPAKAPVSPATPAAEPKKPETKPGEPKPPVAPAIAANPDPAPPEPAEERITLGSIDPASPYRMLVTFTNYGAAVERVELNDPAYLDHIDKPQENYGYLGHLAVLAQTPAVVGVVGPGTPAAKAIATPAQALPGLAVGDVILLARKLPDGEEVKIASGLEFERFLRGTLPGDSIEVAIRRQIAGAPTQLTFTIALTARPMQVIRPETNDFSDPLDYSPDALNPQSYREYLNRHLKERSYLLGLTQIGDLPKETDPKKPEAVKALHDTNIPFRYGAWQITKRPTAADPTVEFTRPLSPRDWKLLGKEGDLEVVKRYTLAQLTADDAAAPNAKAYHLTFEIELRNKHAEPLKLAYSLSGPTGLPEEGWWYSYKVHPTHLMSGSGTRDVIWRSQGKPLAVFSCGDIAERWKTHYGLDAYTPLAGVGDQMQCVGVDAIYFSSVLLNDDMSEPPFDGERNYAFAVTNAKVVGKLYRDKTTRTDVTFQLTSTLRTIPGNGVVKQRFLIFAGPKVPELLEHYALGDSIVYGWFAWFAKGLLWVLHFFHGIVGSYGLSIILLTVLVRLAMFPISRQMAINQQAQQDLAPEIAKINERYKDDMTKRAEATQELYNKHGVNPLSGCMFMPLQMPIFIGLYRGLAVDIALRGAPLIPGLAWCSDLAGPDKLWYWQPFMMNLGLGFLVGDNGYLGPYLNVLPLLTMVLFLWQSRQFQAPAADEQQEMMQNVSTFMMVFMGFLFFKVASGLCLYFIASSLWGIVEKFLVPSTVKKTDQDKPSTDEDDAQLAAAAVEIEARKARKRRRDKDNS